MTVTDEKMSRYFMTIPEAVQLIIRRLTWCRALGRGTRHARRCYLVLEMGDPVKIVDLARNMIRLSGKEPDVDIAIEVVGRRPGEKIHEELFEPARAPAADPGGEDRGGRAAARWTPSGSRARSPRIEELVYDGDASALAGAVAELSAERR